MAPPKAKPYVLPTDFNLPASPAPFDASPVVGESPARAASVSSPRRTRAVQGSSLGGLTFITLRAADPVIQYLIYKQGWGHAVFGLFGLTAATPHIGILSPRQKLFVGFAAVGAARHVFWFLSIRESPMSALNAIHVTVFNLIADTSNTLLSLAIPGWHLSTYQLIGSAMFAIGSAIETLSELQRKWFRRKPENRNAIVDVGLWRVARHINYAGYVLWRGGYAVSTANLYAAWNPLMHLWDFSVRGIPVLEHYMALKHKEKWVEHKQTVPYKLIPFIW
ncbi:uncharacterized protein EV422DRAFT_190298 [Fimicolochytrium jonesii]|uniref:uncharacterized protein n=1 Tax=Fimicolochytrium jonesii TaxID=1396493 RepID=UPI0022FE13DC|nr:uncharacterized protein EV422DRAFT_190298 [Fimicolochytrium jonesii]KAI8818117.1 hypothetical protein EV422DRAFT_190298 [Fimicolochytrium jonesii]